MAENPISERTMISLTISSWWHVAVILTVIVGCYFSLKADSDKALAMGQANADEQKRTSEEVVKMQMNIQSITDNVRYFRETYERDKGRR